MKKRTVITTENREVWVVREGSPDPDLADMPDAVTDAITIAADHEAEELESDQSERNEDHDD